MAIKQFQSKIDRWILLVLILVLVVDFALIVGIALRPESPAATTATILACIAAMALILSVLLRTHYTVDKRELRIFSGPFRWKIPLDQIESVAPTGSALSSPALSLDRLLICYGKRRRVLVSPADKQGFLRAIGHEFE